MRQTVIFLALILPITLFSQSNLVPNPSFEFYNNCPTNASQINNAEPWFQPYTGATGSSTDYFNICGIALLSVPNNFIGYQAANNGVAFSGLISSQTSNYREYLEIQLTDSLIQGIYYCVNFFVSLAELAGYASDGIGAYLSNSVIYYNNPYYGVLQYQPQIENQSGNILTDTANWVLIQGGFIAAGGEKYITIGNFKNDSLTDTLHINSSGYPFSYYYIDDVSVVQGNCSVGINNNNANTDNFIVYPNPTTGIIHLTNNDDAFIDVSDVSGRNILHLRYKQTLNLEQFENGIYYITITRASGEITRSKIILNK